MSLFESFKIGKHTIKNRILVPPFSDNQSDSSGSVSQKLFDNLLRVSKQGAGTIIIDSAYICQQGKGLPYQLGISEEEHTLGLKKMVKYLKEDGVFVGLRLSHAGAKTNHKLCGETPIGPTIINFGKDFEQCREFDEHDVIEICTFFGHAAERAEEIGIDFIEINGAQNLLFDQCLNPSLNTRDDKYGGANITNRMQFAIELIRFIKKRVSNKMLISYFFRNPLDYDSEYKQKNDLKKILSILINEKIDFIHPVLSHATNQIHNSDEYVFEYIARHCDLPIIVDGSIKSTIILKEIEKIDKGTFYCLDKSLFNRQNWYQFIHKKITNN